MKNKNLLKKMESKTNFLKKPLATGIFALVALTAGVFFFLEEDLNVTGQSVNNIVENTQSSPNSIIGILLVLCSLVLGIYMIKTKMSR